MSFVMNKRLVLALAIAAFSTVAGVVGYLSLPRGLSERDRLHHQRAIERLAAIATQAKQLSPYEFGPDRDRLLSGYSPRSPGDAFRSAKKLIMLGHTQTALQWLEPLDGVPHSIEQFAYLRWLSLAYMRLAEQQNCIDDHSAASCIVPLAQSAQHRKTPAASAAIETLERRLQLRPGDVEAQWLLNLAHMYLGQYPDEVPEQWRVAPNAFNQSQSPVVFEDQAQVLGVGVIGRSGGAIFDDFNGDDLPDIMASSWGVNEPLRLFTNTGDGQFVDRTHVAGLSGQWGGLNLIAADYDNDNDLDVFLLRGAWMGHLGTHPNSLLRNNGKGQFTDVTELSGLLDLAPTQTAVFFDVDNDGWIDLAVGNESTPPHHQFPSVLYHNQGDGTFAAEALPLNAFVKALAVGDYDRDGDLDLYASVMGGNNQLLRNDAGVFTSDVAEQAGVQQPTWSFPAWFFDADNDGAEDLFVSGYGGYDQLRVDSVANDYFGRPFTIEPPALYRNLSHGKFDNIASTMGLNHPFLTMGANFADIDNDGDFDFYLGTGAPDLATLTPNRLFLNEGDSFLDITGSARVGHLQKGHGVAFADFDFDGDLDMYHVLGGAVPGDIYPNALFVNQGTSNHWVSVKLLGNTANRSAIGAWLEITGSDDVTQYRRVSTGGSFGTSSLTQHIGLGPADGQVTITITWPDQQLSKQSVVLQSGQYYRIEQGEEPERLSLK